MSVDKRLLYVNLFALVINGIIVLAVTVTVFPLIGGILAIAGCLIGAVWLSCRIQLGIRR